MTNAEDLIQVPGTPWIIASGLSDAEHAGGHIYLVNARQRSLQVLLPGQVAYQHDTSAFGEGDQTVVRLPLDGKTKPAVIKTGFHTDNLRYGSDGLLYAAGQRDTMPNLFACAPNTSRHCTSPFAVLRIDPATLRTREVVNHPGGPNFGASSTALRIGNEFWFGTSHGDRIAIAPVK
jgi:hypothetical protein